MGWDFKTFQEKVLVFWQSYDSKTYTSIDAIGVL